MPDDRSATARVLLSEAQRLLPGHYLHLSWHRETTLVPGDRPTPYSLWPHGRVSLEAWRDGERATRAWKVAAPTYAGLLAAVRRQAPIRMAALAADPFDQSKPA